MSDEDTCKICGWHEPSHATDCPNDARPDEMAAGIIHEPETGGHVFKGLGDDALALGRAVLQAAAERADPSQIDANAAEDRDHCGYVEAEGDVPLYAISGAALDEIEKLICTFAYMHGEDKSVEAPMGHITAARENGPIMDASALAQIMHGREKAFADIAADLAASEQRCSDAQAQLAAAQRETAVMGQQRDFLSGQVNSLVQRLAGAHVAAGSFDMAAAQGFVQKEILPIDHALAQITAQETRDG